jgi:hypothetical protein
MSGGNGVPAGAGSKRVVIRQRTKRTTGHDRLNNRAFGATRGAEAQSRNRSRADSLAYSCIRRRLSVRQAVQPAVHFVGAALRDDVDESAALSSEFGVCSTGDHEHRAHCVDVEREPSLLIQSFLGGLTDGSS